MKSKIVKLIILSSVLSAPLAFAHNGGKHSGKPIEGRASDIRSTGFKVKTETGEKSVETNKDTKFEIGMDGKKGTKSDLKDGAFVMVEGTTLESGVVVATEVMVHTAQASEASATEHKNH